MEADGRGAGRERLHCPSKGVGGGGGGGGGEGGSRWVRAPCLPLVSALNGEDPMCGPDLPAPGNHGDGGAENSTQWPGGSWWDGGMGPPPPPPPTPTPHHRPLIDTQSP